MSSLFDALVDDFRSRDTSARQLVSRTADRLIKKGFIVSAITKIEDKSKTTSKGTIYRVIDRRQGWRIDLIEKVDGKVKHQGHLDVIELSQAVEPTRGYTGPIPAPKLFKPEFVTDTDKTRRKLGEINGIGNKKKPAPLGSAFLLTNRIGKQAKRKLVSTA